MRTSTAYYIGIFPESRRSYELVIDVHEFYEEVLVVPNSPLHALPARTKIKPIFFFCNILIVKRVTHGHFYNNVKYISNCYHFLNFSCAKYIFMVTGNVLQTIFLFNF